MSRFSHRKSQVRLQVLKPDGTPASNVSIRFDQTRHAFLFGCGGFEAIELTQCTDPARRAFLEDRMEKWLGLFNYATLPFYWGRYEPEEGRTMQAATMDGARWLRDRGVTLKGHPLCWHTACADWLLKYDDQAIFDRQIARIHRDVTAFKGLIDMWDVINEVVIMPVFDKYDNAVTRLCKAHGRVGLTRAVFEAAVACNPSGTFLINDFNVSPDYEHLLEELLDAGVPITAIGIQSHQHQGYWGLEKLQDVLTRFSRFGLPIHFTENTLISGEIMPAHIVDLNDWQVESWPSTPEGEERQAREMAEMYSVLFAHPLVEAITTWDFTDGCWLHAPSGVLREDNSIKPAYEALMNLIHGEWETKLELVTDSEGHLDFSGFKGNYEVISETGSAVFSLHAPVNETLVLR